jgi:hypothetical protein
VFIMANLVIADYGLNLEFTAARNALIAAVCYLRLYQNNRTPARTDTGGLYTEANFAGYAPIPFTDWGAITSAADVFSMSAPIKTFLCTGGPTNQIYGYYITGPSAANLYWAQRDDVAPVPIGINGDQYSVYPVLTHLSQFP